MIVLYFAVIFFLGFIAGITFWDYLVVPEPLPTKKETIIDCYQTSIAIRQPKPLNPLKVANHPFYHRWVDENILGHEKQLPNSEYIRWVKENINE